MKRLKRFIHHHYYYRHPGQRASCHQKARRYQTVTQRFGWLGLGLFLMALTPTAMALEKTRALASDARIKVVAYDANNVVPITGTTFTTTQIEFAKDEFIENIQGGDIGAWSANVQKPLPYMLFLKPTIAGSNTNLLVVTNRHTYYFQLKSVPLSQAKASQVTYAIRFIYPKQQRAKQLAALRFKHEQRQGQLSVATNPKGYHWDYTFSGDKRLVPLHVFDDGHFTYFELRPHQPVPAIFAVDNAAGNEAVVNFRRRGRYLVVQQLAPQFTLRNGDVQVASIFNRRLVRQAGGR